MPQKLPVDNFKWIKKDDLLKFDESVIKIMIKIVIKDTFLK